MLSSLRFRVVSLASSSKEFLSEFNDLPKNGGLRGGILMRVMLLLRDTVHTARLRLGSLLWAVGVVAFLLSVASPRDDSVQQEVLRPKSTHVAVRRLPSVPHATRKGTNATQTLIVALAHVPVLSELHHVKPDKAIPSSICLGLCLALRSPPSIC